MELVATLRALASSMIFLLWLFQWNTWIMLIITMIPVSCCNHHSSEVLELFCKHFLVIILFLFGKIIRAESAIHRTQLILVDKTTTKWYITRKYLQNDSSISLEWWLKRKTGIILIVISAQFLCFMGVIIIRKSCNHRTSLGPK